MEIINMAFPIEEIPNTDKVFLRIHKVNLNLDKEEEKEKIKPYHSFEQKGEDGLSVDWSKYATAENTKLRAKKPEDNGVVSFSVNQLRDVSLTVVHKPQNYQAHSLIKDIPKKINDLGIRLILRDICKWEIHYKSDE